jgi:hypothetical protein
MDLSFRQPYVQPNRLTERVLSIDRYARAYRDRIATGCLTSAHLNPQFAAMEEVIAKAERVANVPHRALPASRPAELDLRTFAAARARSIEAQLAEGDPGYAPYWQKGFIGGRVARPAATRPAATRPASGPTRQAAGTKPA